MELRCLFLFLWLAAGLPFRAALAQAVAPSQGGDVGFVRITATTMELRFGTTGTGQGRVVAMAAIANGPVPLAAADGTFYNGNAAYGKGDAMGTGFVVYSGTDHAATVTGLQPNTNYYITNAEYNVSGASIAYNTQGTSVALATRTPLAVELTAFTGAANARSLAVLHWATASEHSSAYFAPERSTNGTDFTEAGRVPAAGASTQPLTYQWADPQLLNQITYYRLRQADQDGSVQYSAVVALAPASHMARQVEVYPSPSTGQPVQLLLRGYERETVALRLADATGRLVLVQTITPNTAQHLAPLRLPASLAPGTYLLTLTGSRPVQKRIIVSN